MFHRLAQLIRRVGPPAGAQLGQMDTEELREWVECQESPFPLIWAYVLSPSGPVRAAIARHAQTRGRVFEFFVARHYQGIRPFSENPGLTEAERIRHLDRTIGFMLGERPAPGYFELAQRRRASAETAGLYARQGVKILPRRARILEQTATGTGSILTNYRTVEQADATWLLETSPHTPLDTLRALWESRSRHGRAPPALLTHPNADLALLRDIVRYRRDRRIPESFQDELLLVLGREEAAQDPEIRRITRRVGGPEAQVVLAETASDPGEVASIFRLLMSQARYRAALDALEHSALGQSALRFLDADEFRPLLSWRDGEVRQRALCLLGRLPSHELRPAAEGDRAPTREPDALDAGARSPRLR